MIAAPQRLTIAFCADAQIHIVRAISRRTSEVATPGPARGSADQTKHHIVRLLQVRPQRKPAHKAGLRVFGGRIPQQKICMTRGASQLGPSGARLVKNVQLVAPGEAGRML
jgi:hypothetical protein